MVDPANDRSFVWPALTAYSICRSLSSGRGIRNAETGPWARFAFTLIINLRTHLHGGTPNILFIYRYLLCVHTTLSNVELFLDQRLERMWATKGRKFPVVALLRPLLSRIRNLPTDGSDDTKAFEGGKITKR